MAKTSKKTQIAAVDGGNGGANGVMGNKMVYIPSVRAAATGDTLDIGSGIGQMDYKFVDWGGFRYLYGDDVNRVSKRALERHIGAERYGNEFHQWLVAVTLGELGVTSGEVDLTLFAPPGLYNKVKDRVISGFMHKGGQVGIQFKGDKKPRAWNYSSVTVWPEGLAMVAALMLNDKGQLVNEELFGGDVLILDVGVHTLDVVMMQNGDFNPEALNTATWEDGGVDVHVRQPVLNIVRKKDEDFSGISEDEIDAAFRSADKKLVKGTAEADLSSLIDKYAKRHAEWIANNIIDRHYHGLRGIKSCIVGGGMADQLVPFLKEWYGPKIFDRHTDKVASKIHPAYWNAVGGYKLALANLED